MGVVLFGFTLCRVRFVNGAEWSVAFVVAAALFCTIVLAKALA